MNYIESLRIVLLFGVLGFFLNRIAWVRGFYSLPTREIQGPSLSFLSVLSVFGIYLLVTWGLAPLSLEGLKDLYQEEGVPFSGFGLALLQLALLLLVGLLLFLLCKKLPASQMKLLWKNPENSGSLVKDVVVAALAWILSFPLIMAVGQLADTLVYFFFGVENFEQVAVRFLKMTLSHPDQLIIALVTIIVVAPCIEELLFRGFLQNYFKKKWGPKVAIVLSSLCFGLFHVAHTQGLGNISLVLSLFMFALFLGFVYERQGSLRASISLHMLFNTLSTLRVLYGI